MSKLKIKLSKVPEVYHNQLFANLLEIRGIEGSRKAILEDVTLSEAFIWLLTPEGHEFWGAISEGGSPKVTVTTKTVSSELEDFVKEAEARGFAIGVSTKFGEICLRNTNGKIYEHELCDDGSFFYRNIRVLSAKGKWCKPYKKEQPSELPDASAIHAILDEIFKFRK